MIKVWALGEDMVTSSGHLPRDLDMAYRDGKLAIVVNETYIPEDTHFAPILTYVYVKEWGEASWKNLGEDKLPN
jgi:hypothetical protein